MSGRRKSKKGLPKSTPGSSRVGRRKAGPFGEGYSATTGTVSPASDRSRGGDSGLHDAGPGLDDPGRRQFGQCDGDIADGGGTGAAAGDRQENGQLEQAGHHRPSGIGDNRRVNDDLADTRECDTGDGERRDQLASSIGIGERDGALRLVQAPWYDVPHYWPQIEEGVQKALSHGSIAWTAEEIRATLMRRASQLWLALNDDRVAAFAITELQVFPRIRVLFVMLIGGQGMDAWLHFEAKICEWGKEMGCVAVEGPGRRGWERKMKSRGWAPVWTVFRKMLD